MHALGLRAPRDITRAAACVHTRRRGDRRPGKEAALIDAGVNLRFRAKPPDDLRPAIARELLRSGPGLPLEASSEPEGVQNLDDEQIARNAVIQGQRL